MPKPREYVFVLWADGFDEATATIFITELREAGLLVKVVGLSPRQITGAHGLALVPDLTLDQALPLAGQAIGLIIPTGRWSERLANDPRLTGLIEPAASAQAKIVIGTWNDNFQSSLKLPPSIQENVIIYPDTEAMIEFARKIAAYFESGGPTQ